MTQDHERRGNTNKDAMPNTLLTTSQACRLLNVHSNTLRRWTARGLIEARRVYLGAHRRYRYEDVIALLREQGRVQELNKSEP